MWKDIIILIKYNEFDELLTGFSFVIGKIRIDFEVKWIRESQRKDRNTEN